MPQRNRPDPFRGFNFRVEINGLANLAFREVSGLTFEIDPVEYREGNEVHRHVRKLSGLAKFSNLQFKRGFTTDMQLWGWYSQVLNGNTLLRDGAIVMTDELQVDRIRWTFWDGWPCKLEGFTANATANDVAVEMLELCVDRVEITMAA